MTTPTLRLHGRRFAPLLSGNEVAARVRALAGELDGLLGSAVEAAKPPLAIGVLNGAAIFHADLVRACEQPLELAYLRTRSYVGTASTGRVTVEWPADLAVDGRRVVLVEDIVDTGRTLVRLVEELHERGAASVKVVVLLDKPTARAVPFQPDLVGFAIEDRFVVGCGLDFDGLGRDLPGVWAVAD